MKIKHSIARSLRGVSHSRSGLPNQDSILLQANGSHYMVAAVADGHGSSNCHRSNTGSRFACELFAEIVKDAPSFSSYDEAKLYSESIPALFINQWKSRVENDLVVLPYASHEVNESNSENRYISYGCTFLGCYIDSKYAVFLQIGDGDMFASFSNGEVKYLVTGDERLYGNATTSMCLPDSEKDFRVSVIDLGNDNIPEIIILATDGLGQSYARDSELFKWGSDLKDIYLSDGGIETIETNLANWLDEVSSNASGDDISMVIISIENKKAEQINKDSNELQTVLSKEERTIKGFFSFLKSKKNKHIEINN